MADERDNCLYCRNRAVLDELMIKVCDLDVSTLYLFREQSHPGRSVVAYKEHVNEQFDIPEEEFVRFMMDVRRTSAALKKAFGATKINLGSYSDTLHHAHWHIVPKFEGEAEWGGIFQMNPKQTHLTDEEYAQRVELIRKTIQEER